MFRYILLIVASVSFISESNAQIHHMKQYEYKVYNNVVSEIKKHYSDIIMDSVYNISVINEVVNIYHFFKEEIINLSDSVEYSNCNLIKKSKIDKQFLMTLEDFETDFDAYLNSDYECIGNFCDLKPEIVIYYGDIYGPFICVTVLKRTQECYKYRNNRRYNTSLLLLYDVRTTNLIAWKKLYVS